MTSLAVIMAINRSNIYELVAGSSILDLVFILVPMLVAVFGKTHSNTGALLSILLRSVSWFISKHLMAISFPSHAIGLVFSILGMFTGKRIDTRFKK